MNQESPLLANILRIGLLLAASIYFFTHFDFTSLNFPGLDTTSQPPHTSQVKVNSTKEGVKDIRPWSQAESTITTPEQDAGNFYTCTDDQGVIHMANDLERVPPMYRTRMKVAIRYHVDFERGVIEWGSVNP